MKCSGIQSHLFFLIKLLKSNSIPLLEGSKILTIKMCYFSDKAHRTKTNISYNAFLDLLLGDT